MMVIFCFIVTALLLVCCIAVTLHFIHRSRRLLDYVANSATNQQAQLTAWFVDAMPLPGRTSDAFTVSMTSLRDRLPTTSLAVQSLLVQTVRPERIHLYLSDAITAADVPPALTRLGRHGLELHFVPDVGPHTKLVHALRDHGDMPILTFDDDVYYPAHSIETLLATARAEPGAIVGNWVRRLAFTPGGRVRKAKNGRLVTPKTLEQTLDAPARRGPAGYDLFAYGAGGILYPPGSLDARVFDTATFRALCPTEDDVWFYAMALLRGTPIAATALGYSPRHHTLQGSQRVALRQGNYRDGGAPTQSQIRAVFDHFDLYARLAALHARQPARTAPPAPPREGIGQRQGEGAETIPFRIAP